MESHPVPQNITSYEFRLVGDMTLKQFGQLAGGVIMALIIYSLPIYPIFKWPMVFVFAVVGVLFAFVPFQERPLSAWLLAFFKAIYSPTQFLWEKKAVVPEYFTVTVRPAEVADEKAMAREMRMAGKQRVEAYLSSLPQAGELSDLEKAERAFLAQLNSLMTAPMVMTDKAKTGEKADDKVTQAKKKEREKVVPNIPVKVDQKKEEQNRPHIKLPEPVMVTAAGKPPTPVFGENKQGITKAASFAPQAPIPLKPTQPNIVVGQVLDRYGRIIENAIIEIKDDRGVPMRALRSNKLGHFQIVTPLPSGKYTIETDKEGFQFDKVGFELEGDVIPPISVIGDALRGGENEQQAKGAVLIYKN